MHMCSLMISRIQTREKHEGSCVFLSTDYFKERVLPFVQVRRSDLTLKEAFDVRL